MYVCTDVGHMHVWSTPIHLEICNSLHWSLEVRLSGDVSLLTTYRTSV